jgi:hypothetical protein
MSGANSVRGQGKIKGSGRGEVRVSDADRASTDLGQIQIEGQVFKPSVFYVLGRSDIAYKGPELHFDFVPMIFKDAMKRPF